MQLLLLATLVATSVSAAPASTGPGIETGNEAGEIFFPATVTGNDANTYEGPTTPITAPELAAVLSDDSTPIIIHKRATSACPVAPTNQNYTDTPNGFLNYAPFQTSAKDAATPSYYTLAFTNLNGAENDKYGYRGYSLLDSYNVTACAQRCTSISACEGFDMYYERAPAVDPSASCTNPYSIAQVKCAYWAHAVQSSQVTNFGQYRRDFMVVMTGSNGYNKTGE